MPLVSGGLCPGIQAVLTPGTSLRAPWRSALLAECEPSTALLGAEQSLGSGPGSLWAWQLFGGPAPKGAPMRMCSSRLQEPPWSLVIWG